MSALVENSVSLDFETEPVGSTPTRQIDQALGDEAMTTNPAPILRPGYSGIEEHSTPFHAFLEHTMTFLFPILFFLNLYFPLDRLYELELLWLVVLAVPIALVLGDFMGGLVHWIADTYFSENTPVLGRALIRPFRLHHTYPRDICTHNLISIVGNVCILAVPVLGFCLYLLWVSDHGLIAFAILCTALMAAATVGTNIFHKWAHEEATSGGVRWLQRTHLVLEPEHHQLHHTEPFNMHYCITNGWLNPFLNKIRFFRRLEAVLRWMGIETAVDRGKQAPNQAIGPIGRIGPI